MNNLTVIMPNKDRLPVFHQYPGSFEAQPAYILLDCQERKLFADYHHGDRYVIPANVYNGHIIRWEIPAKTNRTWLVRTMKAITEKAEQILDGYSTYNDGNNVRGTLSDNAYRARQDAEEIISDMLVDIICR